MGGKRTEKRRHKQLTLRQLSFARNLVRGATITEAAKKAGYSGKNPAQSGHQALEAIRLREPEQLNELGLSIPALIAKHLLPQLEATTTLFLQHKGKITESLQVADNKARLRALDMAFRLHGAYPSQRRQTQADEQIGVTVIHETPKQSNDDLCRQSIRGEVGPAA